MIVTGSVYDRAAERWPSHSYQTPRMEKPCVDYFIKFVKTYNENTEMLQVFLKPNQYTESKDERFVYMCKIGEGAWFDFDEKREAIKHAFSEAFGINK